MSILVFKDNNEKLKIGFHSDSASFENCGRNVDSLAFLNIGPNTMLRVHPFNIFGGADSKINSTITLYDQKILLRKLNGYKIEINGIMRTIEILVTADYKGLDIITGRALGRPTAMGIHTTLTLEQASAKKYVEELWKQSVLN